MKTQFLRFTTEDKLILNGLLYNPEKETKKVVLHIHGMGGNFYENRFLDEMANELTNNDWALFCINTRGHDLMSDHLISGMKEDYKRIGCAFERFEECVLDIKPAIDLLEEKGYEEIVICGHSLGSPKVAYYLINTQDKRINKVIFLSPADMVGLEEKEINYKDNVEKAKQMIQEGKGEEIMSNIISDWYYLSANTYIDLSTRDSSVDIFNLYDKEKESKLNEIKIPILCVFGDKDSVLMNSPEEDLDIIKRKAKNNNFTGEIIKEGFHSYFGKEKELSKKVIEWLVKQNNK